MTSPSAWSHLRVRAALAIPLAAQFAIGQTDCEHEFSCSPPDASDVSYVCSNPSDLLCYEPVEHPSFTPDRRPVFLLNTYCGPTCKTCSSNPDNPKGHAAWWRDATTFTEAGGLEEQLDTAWDAGFRRFIVNRPGGRVETTFTPERVLQAQYFHLTDTQRNILANPTYGLSDWISMKQLIQADMQVGVYIGSRQSGSSCTPCFNDSEGDDTWDCSDEETQHGFTFNYRYFDPTSQSSMQEIYQNVTPWVDIGFNMFGIDSTSKWSVEDDDLGAYPGPRRLLDLIQSPDYAAVQFIGEAAPRIQDPQDPNYRDADPDFVEHAAWLTFWDVLSGPGWEWLDDDLDDFDFPSNEQFVDPDVTELGAVFHKHGTSPAYDIRHVADARDHGFVVWIANANSIGFVQRIHDGDGDEFFDSLAPGGDLSAIADFDFDGDEDCDDFSTFCINWTASMMNAPTDPAVWDGDIDNDDDVDCDDYCAFLGLKVWGCGSCAVIPCFCP